ncbi:tetratricopeptide repeat protein [Streptomyces sp. Ru72]|uniref:tetratricopeptide repeat protein n=1 Tax=Streptomyces sp. Ru72 TaxID=2080747 RepID=UPI000CDD7EDE|nr:tetratricopeptide repeat protein [Streptomyces sp. Ru72]POX41368.1 hypothetical protein C3488_37725 [Streptomyces sp. Ru72]
MRFLWLRRGNDAGQKAASPLAKAWALFKAGCYAEAEAEARAVAAARAGVCDEPLASVALFLAALAVTGQGRAAEAVAEYDGLLPVFGRIFGAEHPRIMRLRSNRAQVLATLGRHAECEAECAAVMRIATRAQGPRMASIATSARNGLVYALNGQGRHKEAEELAREALTLVPHGKSTVALRSNLARSLNGQARHEEALAEAERADEERRGLPEDRRRAVTGVVELTMATTHLALGDTARARTLAKAADDACLAAFGPHHYRTIEARALLDRIDRA